MYTHIHTRKFTEKCRAEIARANETYIYYILNIYTIHLFVAEFSLRFLFFFLKTPC